MSQANTASGPVAPTEQEIRLAATSYQRLVSCTPVGEPPCIQVVARDHVSDPVPLPARVWQLLLDTLAQLAQGNAVALLPVHAELTTQEAAALLKVSRPFLIRVLDTGEIPSRKVGTHRRVRYTDVLAYKQQIDARRRQVLDELTAQAQALGMGYE
jgi:excisionase family DNA binding protein